jgi:DNA-binding MarR family transcriptional regulator
MSKKDTTCSKIRQSWLVIDRMYNTEAVQHDLTTSTGFILLQIDSADGIPSTQIGPRLGMGATSLTRTLNQLEEKGYIERRRDSDDARCVRIVLTQKGKQKRDVSSRTVKAFNAELMQQIGEKKLHAFHKTIEQINIIAGKMLSTSVDKTE